jgi:ABC-type Fe3+/spermidine/putrescine transport system ATPase subunit
VIQVGSPRGLYEHPANAFVASFLGEMNFIAARVAKVNGAAAQLSIGGILLEARIAADQPLLKIGDGVSAAVRPERLQLRAVSDGHCLVGHVQQIVYNGANLMMLIRLDGGPVIRADIDSLSGFSRLAVGDLVGVAWSAPDALVFPGCP